MTPRKKGNKYEIVYRVSGYDKPFSERFKTYEEAAARMEQVEIERREGSFLPPNAKVIQDKTPMKQGEEPLTLGELLDEYVRLYGLNHWGDSYLSCTQHRINDYIKPFIGGMALKDITPLELDRFLDSLILQKAVVQKGHRSSGRTISFSVTEKVYSVLRSALAQAVRWGYLERNPAEYISLSKHKVHARSVWKPETAQKALRVCQDSALKTAMLLALGCSMRIGEILGLTWDCVDCSTEAIENGTAHVFVTKELKRCDKASLQQLEERGRSTVTFVFPERNKVKPASTCLVLKAPKTESSIRQVFLPRTVAEHLREVKTRQKLLKRELGRVYADYGLVVSQDTGRPYEERRIAILFKKFLAENKLPPVVFHSLRHCSASIKLSLSGGNIKAVQGDTGHSQSKMVTDLYAHSFDEERKALAQKMEQQFFQEEKPDDTSLAIELLKSDPELVKLLLSAALSVGKQPIL